MITTERMTPKKTSEKAPKELLVVPFKYVESLAILKNEGWYHIPLETAPERWPPNTCKTAWHKTK